MFLHSPISKAISVTAFLGFTLAPGDLPRHEGAVAASVGIGAREDSAKAKSPDPSPPAAPQMPSTPALPSTPLLTNVPPPPLGTQGPCAAGMLLIDGDYCPDADQVCLKWLDPPPYQNLRCGEYQKPAKCKGTTQHRRFCIDREEYVEGAASPGADPTAVPTVNKSWTEAKAICEARGARLCKETEWEFACEGPDMSPYPYGFKREAGACNIDRTDLGGAEDKLRDHRAPLNAFPQCTSTFGVHDMTGNVDEWVEREGLAAPRRSSLRGGWWLPGRNRCRAATTHHEETYSAKQVGFRCCADIAP